MEVGITKTPKERPLPPLIRTSDVSHGAREGVSTMRIAPLPQTSRASNLLQRRRDKLRAVLALMDNSKIKKSVSRDRDRVMTIKKDALSLLVTDGREGGSLEAGPMWGRVRRGAIADGVLATRSQARERERSTLDKKPLVVRVSTKSFELRSLHGLQKHELLWYFAPFLNGNCGDLLDLLSKRLKQIPKKIVHPPKKKKSHLLFCRFLFFVCKEDLPVKVAVTLLNGFRMTPEQI